MRKSFFVRCCSFDRFPCVLSALCGKSFCGKVLRAEIEAGLTTCLAISQLLVKKSNEKNVPTRLLVQIRDRLARCNDVRDAAAHHAGARAQNGLASLVVVHRCGSPAASCGNAAALY